MACPSRSDAIIDSHIAAAAAVIDNIWLLADSMGFAIWEIS